MIVCLHPSVGNVELVVMCRNLVPLTMLQRRRLKNFLTCTQAFYLNKDVAIVRDAYW